MKMRSFFVAGSAVAAVATFVGSKAIAADAFLRAVFVDRSDPAVRPIGDAGDRAIGRIAVTLVSEASSALAKDGGVSALPNCHLKDIPMTGGTVGGMARITAMKFTSLKVRSPANAPDAAEQLALDKVQAELENGTVPDLLVQRIDRTEGTHEWRVYKPLAVMRQCVGCHGAPNDQSPELRTALQQRYPSDQAMGYRVGAWRGLIRVTVAEAAPPPTPPPAQPAPGSKKSPTRKT